MSAHADLWAIDLATEERTPVAILREQATILGEKTQYVLRGEVSSSGKGASLKHSLSIVVPALDDYTFELLRVEHPLEIYPLQAYFNNQRQEIRDEEAFVEWLRQVLSSDVTAKVVRTLISQAKT